MLVVYDSLRGLIPAKLLEIRERTAIIRFTASRPAAGFRRGDVFEASRSKVVGRAFVLRRKYGSRLIGHV